MIPLVVSEWRDAMEDDELPIYTSCLSGEMKLIGKWIADAITD